MTTPLCDLACKVLVQAKVEMPTQLKEKSCLWSEPRKSVVLLDFALLWQRVCFADGKELRWPSTSAAG